MKKKWIGVFGLIALAAMQVQADNIEWTYTGGTGEWSTASNWDLGVPGAGDQARLISSTDHAKITTAFDGGTFNILMRNGASLDIRANFKTAGLLELGVNGRTDTAVTQSGGTTVIRTLKIGNDNEADTFEAKYTISGGTARATTAVTIGKNGLLDIQGNGGIIQFNNGGASAVTIGNGTVSYTLAVNGVTPINNLGAGGSFNIGTGSKLLIDASSYTGGEGEIDLAKNYSSIVGTFNTDNVEITGLADGLSGEVKYDTGRVYLDVIPEPAAISLILLSSAVMLFARRRLS